jgi:RimJ/RimL family protein N-acetyltransferase
VIVWVKATGPPRPDELPADVRAWLDGRRHGNGLFVRRPEGDQVLEPLELRSSRLCLRRLRPEDADAISGYRSLPEVARFQSWESFGPTDAADLIAAQLGVEPGTPGTWLQLALVAVESAGVIGDCGLHFRGDDPRQVEVGITLAPAHQGRGLAAEALGSVLDFVCGRLGKHRVSAVTDAANYPAAALLRRLGFRQEAHHVEHVWFKGAWSSEYVFALLHREWQERRTT